MHYQRNRQLFSTSHWEFRPVMNNTPSWWWASSAMHHLPLVYRKRKERMNYVLMLVAFDLWTYLVHTHAEPFSAASDAALQACRDSLLENPNSRNHLFKDLETNPRHPTSKGYEKTFHPRSEQYPCTCINYISPLQFYFFISKSVWK